MRWKNTGPRKRQFRAPAAFIDPCIPTKVDKPPEGDRWAHEIKHDGFRLQIHAGGNGTAELYTRTGATCTDRYPAIAEAARKLKRAAIIDAEAVIIGPDGITDFKAMESRQRDDEAFAYVFDLMVLDGEDLRQRPWLERRELLRKILRKTSAIHFNDHHLGQGPEIYEQACRMGLEGIVSKLIDAPYRSGRSRAWLKVKNPDAPGVLRFKE